MRTASSFGWLEEAPRRRLAEFAAFVDSQREPEDARQREPIVMRESQEGSTLPPPLS